MNKFAGKPVWIWEEVRERKDCRPQLGGFESRLDRLAAPHWPLLTFKTAQPNIGHQHRWAANWLPEAAVIMLATVGWRPHKGEGGLLDNSQLLLLLFGGAPLDSIHLRLIHSTSARASIIRLSIQLVADANGGCKMQMLVVSNNRLRASSARGADFFDELFGAQQKVARIRRAGRNNYRH